MASSSLAVNSACRTFFSLSMMPAFSPRFSEGWGLGLGEGSAMASSSLAVNLACRTFFSSSMMPAALAGPGFRTATNCIFLYLRLA